MIVVVILNKQLIGSKEESRVPKNTEKTNEKRNTETEKVEETLTSVLDKIGDAVQRGKEELSRETINWQTKENEVELSVVGYKFKFTQEDADRVEKVSNLYSSVKTVLLDLGFERYKYNIGSSSRLNNVEPLKYENIGCVIYKVGEEMDEFIEIGFFCSELPQEVISSVEGLMSEKDAREIAETSECINEGSLKGEAFYNENSKTWWFDLDAEKPGCNPACVVYEDRTVEVNWRCTGLIPE